jgi:hypothetical protein
MIPTTHAARRDDIGFLTRRIPKLLCIKVSRCIFFACF